MEKNKKCLQYLLFLLVWGFGGISGFSQSESSIFPEKPEPAVYVHDYANWLSTQQKAQLESKLRTYWDSTSTQIVVMIRPDLGDYDRTTYAVELGNRWGIGNDQKDNGVVVLIKTEAPDRGVFIATGYGAEGGLTDLEAGRIIRNTMAPYFRSQEYYAGIDAGTNEIIAALGGEFSRSASDTEELSDEGQKVLMLFILLFILFIVITAIGITLSSRAKGNGEWYNRGGTFEDRRTTGGWWHTGGGSSGGSGWGSGSSDGGSFGGGDFGGGGAGGDW